MTIHDLFPRAAADKAWGQIELPEGWPIMAPDAFQGIAGQIVDAFDPVTEADPVALREFRGKLDMLDCNRCDWRGRLADHRARRRRR